MHKQTSFINGWIQDNNDLANKCKRFKGGVVQVQNHLKECSFEFHKLLRIIQGIPPLVEHADLELSVVYNACLCSVAHHQFPEAELVLRRAADRVLQMTGADPEISDTVFWKTVFELARSTAITSRVLYVAGVQWAVWLASSQLKTIEEFQDELFTLSEILAAEDGNEHRKNDCAKSSTTPLMVMDPRRLFELLAICTLIAQGAEMLNEGQSSEALAVLQRASSLPAPRKLVAHTHMLSGACFTLMNCPQMALHCYKEALETDPQCVCALYQSILVYRTLGNLQAELQALRLLHSMMLSTAEASPADAPLLSPSSLLPSRSLKSLLSVPSALSLLHCLAQKCVLQGRVLEGVEHFLDLLASLHSGEQYAMQAEVSPLPRLPEFYLEAGAALLMAQRPADCMALCDEVIGSTLELLPKKLVLEEEEGKGDTEAGAEATQEDERMRMLLWTGAAYLLQGHCHTHLKDWKQAVTHYTRCINLLVRVLFKQRGCPPQIPDADVDAKCGTHLSVLKRLKGLSLAGRGISFLQTEQLREALRDLQLSLHALPGCVGAGLWRGEVLWRLGRKQEAAACWEETWSFATRSPSEKSFLCTLLEPQSGPVLDSEELRHRVKELIPP
uniref:FA complementation group G n=1 Tax=Tetraodon nigroviridis TaxID=99883 RepID=H3BX27_TETNG